VRLRLALSTHTCSLPRLPLSPTRPGASAYAAAFLYRHSPLAGSDDLRRWAQEGTDALSGAWRAHLVEPVIALRDELFKTFREWVQVEPGPGRHTARHTLGALWGGCISTGHQDLPPAPKPRGLGQLDICTAPSPARPPPCSRPSIVSSAEFEADRDSLLRMLSDFQRDRPQFLTAAAATAAAAAAAAATAGGPATSEAAGSTAAGGGDGSAATEAAGGGGAADAVGAGMAAVMSCYEAELKSPIRNIISGDLARTLLIQVGRPT
jgi:hypothetical protein